MPKITIAPEFYASLRKLAPEDQQKILAAISELSDLTMDEVLARSTPLELDDDDDDEARP